MDKEISRRADLGGYLTKQGISQSDFAEIVNSRQSIISRIVNGKIRPSLDLAYRIEVATDKAVPAISWASPIAPQTESAAQ